MLRLPLVAAVALGLALGVLAPARAEPAGSHQTAFEASDIGGRVRAPSGTPVADAVVTLYPAGWVPGDPLSDPLGGVQVATDGDGRWVVDANYLTPGTYRIRAGHSSYDARWFGGADATQATSVDLGPATPRTDLDIQLGALPTIAGVVTAHGTRLEGMGVGAELVDALGPEHVTDYFRTATDADGRYEFTLPSGRYEIEVDDPLRELPSRWFGDVTDDDDAALLTVPPGGSLNGIDIDMSFQPVFPGRPRKNPKGLKPPQGVAQLPVDPLSQYQGQAQCRPRPKPGTVALADMLRRRYGPITIGLNRACRRDRSEHYDGRALDWMVNSEIKSQALKGDDFVKWLTMSRGRHVGVMARRLGIMYVIWRDRIWGVYAAQEGWRPYNDCMSRSHQTDSWDNDCHRNHVHISLTWAGARQQTSWWRN